MTAWTCASFSVTASATSEIYSLSLHDALPISLVSGAEGSRLIAVGVREGPANVTEESALGGVAARESRAVERDRSEEHTSELQSQSNLVCRLLLEKKKNQLNVNMQGMDRLETA